MASANEDLLSYFEANSATAKLYKHQECRTSEESAQARAEAGAGMVIGAKAILVKADVRDSNPQFFLLVLPGFSKIDSKKLKTELKDRIPGFRSFRFATSDEMAQVAHGMQPGCMPPFGKPIFPGINYVFVDDSLSLHPRVGFNAAKFTQSAVLNIEEYLRILNHDGIFSFATEG